ncbi:MAG: UDP-N-acetylmuramoyl-L-alanine--D-glutamate ligase [Proteobacteria bacterium]|nr:UDP-N-acetylmuramoyl-L-alanine--D-glutamate ligase [Pseudomonadota bacterium]
MFAAPLFAGKCVAVFGLARSGISCATALQLGGAEVLAWDDSEPSVEKARAEGVRVTNLHTVDFKSLAALVLSPGVPLTHPEPHWTVIKAKAAGIEVIGDTEVFARVVQGSGARMVAITGTNGKSTTTALTGHVLKHAGLDVDVGGNIGNAVFNLRQPVRDRTYVLELSSFQIDLMPGLSPDVGVLTNLTPDHLDRHGTMQHYADVKARMFAKQRDGQTALIGVDDEWCSAIASHIHAGPDVRRVSVARDRMDGISAPDGILSDRSHGKQRVQIDLRDMAALRGRHNWQNACMAYGAATALGVKPEMIREAMHAFPGLAHRMQQVASLGRVLFINDSKATNADAAEKALSSFEDIFWIAGGIAKSGGIEPLEPHFGRVTKAYLIGVAAPEFARTLEGKVPYEMSETLPRAVQSAARDAAARGGGVVLLSPACASFDHYKNFEVRGDAFVDTVSRLPGIHMTLGSSL